MLLIFDALYETIKDSNDSDLKVIYSDLAKKYRDDKNEFINTDSNKLFMLKRDARRIFLDIYVYADKSTGEFKLMSPVQFSSVLLRLEVEKEHSALRLGGVFIFGRIRKFRYGY